MGSEGEDVYCTLLLSDSYLRGAQVLAHSLRDAGTQKKLAVLATLDGLSASALAEVEKLYDYIIPVDRIRNRSPGNLLLMNRVDLDSTFTKINLWRQVQFRKIVYLDADVVALRAPEELFEIEQDFAAAPDVGWPDCFNSGVLVLKPNMADFYSLLALAQRGISFDGADQGLLNMHFRSYHRISFRYNCTPSSHYQYLPAYRHFQSEIALLHFIGKDKPWWSDRGESAAGPVYEESLGRWWAVYDRHFRATTGEGAVGRAQSSSKGGLHEATDDTGNKASAQVTFTAPQTAWDPTKSAPPSSSRPEAANFPQQTYEMSQDPILYKAPSAYPVPPKDLWYEMPKASSFEKPLQPIFPWESKAPKPTRVFAEDLAPITAPVASSTQGSDDDTQLEEDSPTTPTARVLSPEPWQNYTATNAWDEIPEIENFISSITQHRRGQVQILHDDSTGEDTISLGGRRPSSKLTDFPTEIERPSLPVTPAPVRRPSFWGSERDEEGELPAAEGVPSQADWDPSAKLEELSRRQSDVLPRSSVGGAKVDVDVANEPALRELPQTASPIRVMTHQPMEISDQMKSQPGQEEPVSTIAERDTTADKPPKPVTADAGERGLPSLPTNTALSTAS